MFIVSALLLVISVNIVKSSEETLNRCDFKYGDLYMICDGFEHTYLPYIEKYKKVTNVKMYGNFSEIIFDPAYNLEFIHIDSTNLQKFEFENYTNFTQLSRINIFNSEQAVQVDFTGAEKLSRLNLNIQYNKMVNYSCESLKSSNLKNLYLRRNNLETFDFSCVPKTIETLDVEHNRISTLNLPLSSSKSNLNTSTSVDNSTTTHSYCSYLKNLTSLTSLSLSSNRLQDFGFKCLPNSIRTVTLDNNNITEITDLIDILRCHRCLVFLYIKGNPINCTCSTLQDYVQLLDSGRLQFGDFYGDQKRLTCVNVDSEIADYPWYNNATDIKLHDASSLICLNTSEAYNSAKHSKNCNDNNTKNSRNNNENNDEVYIVDHELVIDGGNSGSLNFIDVSLVIISNVIQLSFILF